LNNAYFATVKKVHYQYTVCSTNSPELLHSACCHYRVTYSTVLWANSINSNCTFCQHFFFMITLNSDILLLAVFRLLYSREVCDFGCSHCCWWFDFLPSCDHVMCIGLLLSGVSCYVISP